MTTAWWDCGRCGGVYETVNAGTVESCTGIIQETGYRSNSSQHWTYTIYECQYCSGKWTVEGTKRSHTGDSDTTGNPAAKTCTVCGTVYY